MNSKQYRTFLTFGFLTFMLQSHAALQAHFPWLVRESSGKLAYYFGEGITDRTYRMPPTLATAKVFQMSETSQKKPVPMKPIQEPDFVGLKSDSTVQLNAVYVSQATFGIYHGSRLEYYSLHYAGKLPTSRKVHKTDELNQQPLQNGEAIGCDLSVELVDTDSGVDCYVSWKGQPAKDIEVHLYCSEGHEEATATTDATGKVSFTDNQVEEGLNGLMLGHKLSEPGKLDEKVYENQSHYLTVTFIDPETAETNMNAVLTTGLMIPKLPVEVTSFGAARLDDSLYVFGGHTGSAHSYSNESQNDKLLKLDLNHLELGWQEIATGPKLQGLGMVAHGTQVISIGGFTAKNAEGQPHDLHSQATVVAFDVQSKVWDELPSLPDPRSSHDAAIIGSTIYVVGGWNMQGASSTQWHTKALAMNLGDSRPVWKEIANPPFVRRALAVVAHEGALFAIGGMNESGGPTREVMTYEPNSDTWSHAGQLVGEKPMAGFGASAWSNHGKLIATTFEGSIQTWNAESRAWVERGHSKDARFFHRILPLNSKSLVSLGGANMNEGKFAEVEIITIE